MRLSLKRRNGSNKKEILILFFFNVATSHQIKNKNHFFKRNYNKNTNNKIFKKKQSIKTIE